ASGGLVEFKCWEYSQDQAFAQIFAEVTKRKAAPLIIYDFAVGEYSGAAQFDALEARVIAAIRANHLNPKKVKWLPMLDLERNPDGKTMSEAQAKDWVRRAHIKRYKCVEYRLAGTPSPGADL